MEPKTKAPGDLRSVRTKSRPVTLTISDVGAVEGCASRVVTLCCTFWKGSDCAGKNEKKGWFGSKHVGWGRCENIHCQLLHDVGSALKRCTLECEHR